MSITLELTPEVQAELERRAAVRGTSLSDYVREIFEDQFETTDDASASNVSYEQWRAEFRALLASQKSRNPHFDDSRESIYD